MFDDLEELYQQVILDHSRRPRNYGELVAKEAGDLPVVHVHGDNPSCGDEIDVFVQFDAEGRVADLKFTGQGCAISQASASLMTLKAKGRSQTELEELLKAFHALLSHKDAEPAEMLGDVQVLQGVWKFPQRVKCATLAWRALEQAAAKKEDQITSTENESHTPHS